MDWKAFAAVQHQFIAPGFHAQTLLRAAVQGELKSGTVFRAQAELHVHALGQRQAEGGRPVPEWQHQRPAGAG